MENQSDANTFQLELQPKAGKPSWTLSIAFADNIAIGHVNTGMNLYRQFEQIPGSGLDHRSMFEAAVSTGVPAITNMALGLELLLKEHKFQLSGEYPRGHDISKLGSSFPDDVLQTLRRNYEELYADPSISKGIELKLASGIGRASDWPEMHYENYDDAIKYIGRMYERWRYIYEELHEDFNICVAFAPLYFTTKAVHRAIREFRGNTVVKIHEDESAGTS